MMRNTVMAVALAAASLLIAEIAAAQAYPRPIRDAYMASCIREGGTYTTCQCVLLQVETQIPLDKFVKMRETVQAGGDADQAVLAQYDKIVAGCIQRARQ
jgi:hypothetical protein